MARKSPKLPPAAVSTAMTDATAPVDAAAKVAEAGMSATADAIDTAGDAVADTSVAPLSVATDAAAAAPTIEDSISSRAAQTVAIAADEAASVQKDVTHMATQFDTPKVFEDMTDRTKTAVEKTQKFAAEFGDFGKGNVEAMVEAGKIAAKGFETLGQDNADFTRRSFEGMTTTFKSLASVKSPTEFMKLQSEYLRSAFDGVVQQTSKNTEAMIKLTSDAVQPLSNRFAVAVEKVKTAA